MGWQTNIVDVDCLSVYANNHLMAFPLSGSCETPYWRCANATVQPVKRFRERRDNVWLLDATVRHGSSRVTRRRFAKGDTFARPLRSRNGEPTNYFFGHNEILALELGRAEPKADASSEPHKLPAISTRAGRVTGGIIATRT
jgi:hypothetical protein